MGSDILDHPNIKLRLEQEGRRITLSLPDGTRVAVAARPLRFACQCDICGDVASGKRWLPPDRVPARTSAAAVEVGQGGELRVAWSDGHRSEYSLPSFRRLAGQAEGAARFRPTPWDASVGDRLRRLDCSAALTDDGSLFSALRALRDDGLVLLTDVPREAEDTLAIAARFGPVRETSYGKVFDLISKPASRVAGETSRAQLAHTDEPFRYAPPGFIFFHAIRTASGTGGTSIMVDGFEVARRLRETRPGAFELLTRAGVTHFRHHAGEAHFETEAHVISLDAEGDVTGIRFNDRCLAPHPGRGAASDALLDALGAFSALLQDEALQWRHQLKPGEMLVFDNGRVLHGRTEFDPAAGMRHLRSCNIDRDAVHSAFRTFAARFAPEEADKVLYQGPIL